ncbi:thioredoxin-like-domain-containing protein [Chytriomyces cf. hyalinus JEL632]|nr:thioredoxin-like-domain-containing protein [Chytriomyces cf. hyalinus JEL632]
MSTAAIAATKKHILLYFSASWGPPCQRFTPKLIDFFDTYSAATNNTDIEIIFISSDRDEASFNAYFAKMPFLALPYAQRDRVVSLHRRWLRWVVDVWT